MHTHHCDLVAYGKAESHRKNAIPFSRTRTFRCWCIIGEGGHIRESGRFEVACVHACLPVYAMCTYTCVASTGHICDYVEGYLYEELCDVMMYTVSIYKQAIIL